MGRGRERGRGWNRVWERIDCVCRESHSRQRSEKEKNDNLIVYRYIFSTLI